MGGWGAYTTTDERVRSSCAGEACCSGRNYYDRLQVHLLATEEEVRTAYRRLAKVWHPDRHRGDGTSTAMFQLITEAYEVLSDPERRFSYDLEYLSYLNAEEYLTRFHDFLLTANGLGLQTFEDQQLCARAWNPAFCSLRLLTAA